MKKHFENVIATKFELESAWRKKWLYGRERKIEGFPDCRKLSRGALYESSGHIIYESIRKGGIYGDYVISITPTVIDPKLSVQETIAGKSAFIGNIFSQYGHFITEGISRLHDFSSLDQYDHLLMYPFIFNKGNTELQSYHKWFFDKLGIDQSKIRFIDKTSRIESVTVYEQLWTINYSVDAHLKAVYTYLREHAMVNTIDNSRFLLSRRKSDRIENLAEIEDLFDSNGYKIIYPEELSMDEQMAVYTGRNIIVSLSGTSIHNILFGSAHSTFVELGDSRTPCEPHIMQVLANSLSDAKYLFIPFVAKGPKQWNIDSLSASIKSF